MADLLTNERPGLADITAEERARLLRYCTRVTSDAYSAEDLVQQTLLEAWQHAHRISTPDLRGSWLFGVARNVCLRWLRTHGREAARHVPLADADAPDEVSAERELVATDDPVEAMERQDLVDLLERALASLPPATRAVLVGRYIEDVPQSVLAERLGVSEGAVEARLQRGKQALHRLLTTTFRDQLTAYGLDGPVGERWEATRIWCPACGQHRLLARMPGAPGTLAFRCPGCQPDPTVPRTEYRLTNSHFLELIGGLSRPRAVLKRAATWIHPYFSQALETGWISCTHCGHRSALRIDRQTNQAMLPAKPYRLSVECEVCQEAVSVSLGGLIEALPQVQRFWQQHGRMRTLPIYEVEAGGQAVLVARFEAVTTTDALTVVVAREPFRLLHIAGDLPAKEGI
ncbi:MAG TPA: RNA polymerase sigma factor [Chloroflexia bacterium]|nr:RNA polymerase sigma factor [Chloroflexia bacterium]